MNHVSIKKTKFVIVLMCLLLGFSQWTTAQNNVVRGKVTDAVTGEAVLGANVIQKGASNVGTATDENGNFTLNVPGNATLVVSYLGYLSQEIKVNNQSNLSIKLSEDNQMLQEVVVTGYGGTQRKIDLAGSVSSINNKQLTITKNENVVNMLAGKLPGVRITQRTSQPGEYNTVIDVRGFGEPLFVVDGVPRDKGFFARMDAEEIESIDLLKDASAAIYGIRAANGVLLVTTKKGTAQSGKVDVSYSGQVSFQQMLNIPDGYNMYEWMTLRNEQNYRDFNNMYFAGKPPVHTDDEVKAALTAKNYNWQKRIFRDVTPQTKHNLTINGGTETLRYFFNMGYMRQDACYTSGSLWADALNISSSVDAKIVKGLTLSTIIRGTFNNRHLPGGTQWDDYKAAFLVYPGTPFYANDNPDYLNGYTRWSSEFTNLIGKTDSKYVGYKVNNDRRINGTATITYEIPGVKGLSVAGSYDYMFNLPDETQYGKKYNTYSYDVNTDTYTVYKVEGGAYSTVQRQMWLSTATNMQLRAAYKNRFGKHSVDALGAYEEAYDSWGTGFYAKRNMIVNSDAISLGEGDGQSGGGDRPIERAQRAFIGKINYSYADKYLLSVTGRYEGSSRWPKDSRWGFFPGVSVGWRLSEENFIKNNLGFVSNLKLRASYAKIADQGNASDYPDIYVGYNLNNNQLGWIYTPGSGQSTSTAIRGASANAIPNLNKTWIKVTTQNAGLDFGFLKDRISGSIDYFQRDRTGLMANSSAIIPGTVGASLPQININADRNYGYELELMFRNRGRDYDYYFGGQFSSTRRTNRYVQETPASNSYDNWKNRYAYRFMKDDMWWSRKMEGMFTSLQQVHSFTTYPINQDYLPGDWWTKDWNGDGIINDDDQYPVATKGLPWMNYGLTMGGSFKNFTLDVSFQGTLGVWTQLSEIFVEALPFGGQNSMNWFLDRWHPVDPKADYWNPNTQWVSGYYPLTGGDGRRQYSNGIMNASYLRMKTLELGYNVPKSVLTQMKMKNLRIYVNGWNLLTFTPLRNVDPERPSSTQYANGSDGGADKMYVYPNDKSYTVGLRVTF